MKTLIRKYIKFAHSFEWTAGEFTMYALGALALIILIPAWLMGYLHI